MATPSATRVSGTARTRISVTPKRSWSGPVRMTPKVAQGLAPMAASTSATSEAAARAATAITPPA